MKTISILGCGWIGYALALKLKHKYLIKVSTTSLEKIITLEKEGFKSFLIDDSSSDSTFYECNILVIAIPPSKSKDYLELLRTIYSNILDKTKVIFISSTSIYQNIQKEFFENESMALNKDSLVYKAEELIKNRTNTIFRCAGLMGYNRIAGKSSLNKTLDNEDQMVNYVHRDDVLNAIIFSIDNCIEGIYNLCSKEHPSKRDIYVYNSLKYGFAQPLFLNKKRYPLKIINSDTFRKKGFKYIYQSPFDFC